MPRSVGVVVPAYRPSVETLRRYVTALHEELAPDAIRVELDAPSPGVADALSALPAEVSVSPDRRGKGAAITAGFEALETDVDVLAFADADGSTPATSLADVVAPLLDGEADLSVGSRRHPGAAIRSHQTRLRRHLGDGFAWLARALLDVPLHDYQCGAKALTREAWTAVREHLYEPGFAWDVELVAVADALGHRVAEVPVVWEDHPDSTVAASDAVPELLRALLVTHVRANRIRGRPLYGLFDRGGRPSLVERLAAGSNE